MDFNFLGVGCSVGKASNQPTAFPVEGEVGGGTFLHQKRVSGYDSKLDLFVKVWFQRTEECGVAPLLPFLCS